MDILLAGIRVVTASLSLVSAYARILLADFLDELHYKRFFHQTLQYLVLMLIVGLFTHTKQTAQGNDLIPSPVPFMQPTGYLVPAFFSFMPYTSSP